MKKIKLILAGMSGLCIGLFNTDSFSASSVRGNNQRVGIVNSSSSSSRTLTVGRLRSSTVATASSSSSSDLYDLGTCSKKYMNCLKKSDVCGSDFSKCHSKLTFEANKTYCADVLSSCTSSARSSSSLNPTFNSKGEVTGTGLIDLAIKNGLSSSAESAVEDCLDEVESCVNTACSKYPQMCDLNAKVPVGKKGDEKGLVVPSDKFSSEYLLDGENMSNDEIDKYPNITMKKNTSDLRNGFLQSQCERTVGTNESCKIIAGYDPLTSGKTTRDFDDDDMSDVYTTVLGNYSSQIASLASSISLNFRDKMASTCFSTMSNCVQNSCMGGSLAACYANAKSTTGDTEKINLLSNSTVSDSIKTGCEDLINSNKACNYAYVSDKQAPSSKELFNYLWDDEDPAQMVSKMNGLLASSYSDGQVRELKLSCQSAVEACIDGVCGPDYSGCFVSGKKATKTLSAKKTTTSQTLGDIYGYLDEDIVKGMCLPEVKKNQDCLDTYFANYGSKDGVETSAGKGRWGSPTKGLNKAWQNSSGTKSEDTIFNELLSDYQTVILATMKNNMLQLRNACINAGDNYSWAKKQAYQGTNQGTPDGEDTDNVLNNTCWVRVDLKSDDTKLSKDTNTNKTRSGTLSQEFDSKWFQAGAPITCGEWNSTEIKKRTLDAYKKDRTWATVASTVAGAGLGVGLAEGVLNKKMGITTQKEEDQYNSDLKDYEAAGGDNCYNQKTTEVVDNSGDKCTNCCDESGNCYTLDDGRISNKSTSTGKIWLNCKNGYTPSTIKTLKSKVLTPKENDSTNKGKRAGSDIGFAAAGATILGLTVNKSMSASEIKKGYENVHCYIGGTKVADYGETFQLDKQQ